MAWGGTPAALGNSGPTYDLAVTSRPAFRDPAGNLIRIQELR
jgi:hypothetical protein